MSYIQAIIASISGGSSSWIYPPIGNGYPIASSTITENVEPAVVGYYQVGSLNTPRLGLYRRTYTAGDTLVRNEADSYVGFGYGTDVAENFNMEWLGYFKPAQTGDFVFSANIDDAMQMWIGETAVLGFDESNTLMQVDNGSINSLAYPMISDRYYPVRIRFVENSGDHNCTIWSGLNGTTPEHNQQSAATGQFFYDINTSNSAFPGSGLITT